MKNIKFTGYCKQMGYRRNGFVVKREQREMNEFAIVSNVTVIDSNTPGPKALYGLHYVCAPFYPSQGHMLVNQPHSSADTKSLELFLFFPAFIMGKKPETVSFGMTLSLSTSPCRQTCLYCHHEVCNHYSGT